MLSSEFRDIANRKEAGKGERLFRAAVSAFCSLTRPSRRDALQLDDLTLPLFDSVSIETRRYVAAALSECDVVPPNLLHLLCDEPVDISAPLLVRSRALTDADLVAIIQKHGVLHAQAISRRPGIGTALIHLIRTMMSEAARMPDPDTGAREAIELTSDSDGPPRISASEAMRNRLRMMMRPGAAMDAENDPGVFAPPTSAFYAKLRDTALTGNPEFFHTAFADAMKVNVRTAKSLLDGKSNSQLIAALKALDLSEEQAFLVLAASTPSRFAHPEAIRLFLERYRSLSLETARERVRGWKLDMVATWITENAFAQRAGNGERDKARQANRFSA